MYDFPQPTSSSQVFSSSLPLQVTMFDRGGSRRIEPTSAEREIEVPAGYYWFVEPTEALSDQDWETLLGEISEREIPGLKTNGRMSDRHLDMMSGMNHLIYLDLSGTNTGITDRGLKNLAKLPGLLTLELRLNASHDAPDFEPAEVSDAGLMVLEYLPRLNRLDLGTLFGVTNATIGRLRNHQRLRELDLSLTATGDEALQTVHANQLLFRIAPGALMTDWGLAQLSEFGQLAELNDSWQDHPNENSEVYESLWLERLFLPALDLRHCPGITDAGLGHLAELDGLRSVQLPRPDTSRRFASHIAGLDVDVEASFSERGAARLCQMSNLRELHLSGEWISDEWIKTVAGMPKLFSLATHGGSVGDEGFAALASSDLRKLVGGSENMTAKTIAALASARWLQFMDFGGVQLDDESMKPLSGFYRLRELWTAGTFTDEAFQYIVEAPRLERLLNLGNARTGDLSTEYATRVKELRYFCASDNQITDLSLKMLAGVKTLEGMHLRRCPRITNAGLVHLAQAPHLDALRITACDNITERGIETLPDRIYVDFTPCD